MLNPPFEVGNLDQDYAHGKKYRDSLNGVRPFEKLCGLGPKPKISHHVNAESGWCQRVLNVIWMFCIGPKLQGFVLSKLELR